MLPTRANLSQPLREDRWETGLHFGRDESGFVEILEMHLVLHAEAGELRADQIRVGSGYRWMALRPEGWSGRTSMSTSAT